MKEKTIILLLLFLGLVVFKSSGQDIAGLDVKEKEVVIYPNPLIGDKFIVKSDTKVTRVEIVNVIGKVINRTENENADIKELQIYMGKCEKGMYFVKIIFEDNKSIIKKLLVK